MKGSKCVETTQQWIFFLKPGVALFSTSTLNKKTQLQEWHLQVYRVTLGATLGPLLSAPVDK